MHQVNTMQRIKSTIHLSSLLHDFRRGKLVPKVSVSVLTALQRNSQRLKRSIDSLVGQTFQDWELIIVDDASTNDAKIFHSDIGMQELNLLRMNKILVSPNLSICCSNLQGNIARLDSDDYCLPERLLKQWEFMQLVTMSFVVPVIKRNMSQSWVSVCAIS